MGKIRVAQAKEGMILDADVKDRLGRLVAPSGATLTVRHLAAFRVLGITDIRTRDPEGESGSPSELDTLETVANELRPVFRLTDLGHPAMAELFKACVELRARQLEGGTLPSLTPPVGDLPGDNTAPAPAEAKPKGRESTEWVKKLSDLPSLPNIHVRITQVVDNPNSSARDVARIVEDDPGLTARLLRLVNSALYALPNKTEDISRALAIIGMTQLKELALATSVSSMFKQVPSGLITMKSFWTHSVACGIAARIIASLRGDHNAESMFISGLLHDIGTLILCTYRSNHFVQAAKLADTKGLALAVAERAVSGFDHAAVGATLLDAWNLPLHIRKTVAYHHEPHQSTAFPMEAAIVHIADIVATAMQVGSSGERLVPPLNLKAWDLIRVDHRKIPQAVEGVSTKLSDVMQTFGER